MKYKLRFRIIFIQEVEAPNEEVAKIIGQKMSTIIFRAHKEFEYAEFAGVENESD